MSNNKKEIKIIILLKKQLYKLHTKLLKIIAFSNQ